MTPNKNALDFSKAFQIFGSPTWTRTSDLRINSPEESMLFAVERR